MHHRDASFSLFAWVTVCMAHAGIGATGANLSTVFWKGVLSVRRLCRQHAKGWFLGLRLSIGVLDRASSLSFGAPMFCGCIMVLSCLRSGFVGLSY